MSTKMASLVRIGAIGGVVGPVLFVVGVLVAGAIYDGYSHASQKISELGGVGAEFALVQNINFTILGFLVMGFAWALAVALGPPRGGVILVGVFGLVAAIHGLLVPCDLGCAGATTTGLIHNVTGLAGFVSALTGLGLLARRWRNEAEWVGHVAFTWISLGVAGGGLVWFVITQATDRQGTAGIAQRVFAITLLAWICLTAIRLLRIISSRETASRGSQELQRT